VKHAGASHAGSRDGLADRAGRAAHAGPGVAAAALGPLGSLVANDSEKEVILNKFKLILS